MANPTESDEFYSELLFIKPGKWNLVIITCLKPGAMRFNALKSRIGGISQKVLSATLRDLERDGMVSRTQYPSIPPRVEYDLTALGREFLDYAEIWARFVKAHHPEVEAARAEFDRRHDAEAHTGSRPF